MIEINKKDSIVKTVDKLEGRHSDWPFLVSVEDYTPDGEEIIARAASICYDKEESSRGVELIPKLMELKHIDTTRFAYLTIKIDGISVGAHSQIVRIAHFGILVMSSRYVDLSEKKIILPKELAEYSDIPLKDFCGEERLCQWEEEATLEDLLLLQNKIYRCLRKNGVKKQDARYISFDGRETSMWMSANLQAWMHFFRLRLPKKVMPETRALAETIYKLTSTLFPRVFNDKFLDEIGCPELKQENQKKG